MDWPQAVLLTNLATTLFMVGLIWMVQIVHYPLFDGVGETDYVRYQHRHQTRITFIVGPVMLLELFSTLLMVWFPAAGVSTAQVAAGIGLVTVIWLSTAFLQVPCHNRLTNGFDRSAFRFLVRSNWIRTLAWTARGILVLWMTANVF